MRQGLNLKEHKMKPLIVIDFDDVIAKTGEKKLEWIRKNLQNKKLSDGRCLFDLKSEECSRTLLVPIIGEESYKSLCDYALSEENTMNSEPLAGVVESIEKLSEKFDLVILSARGKDYIEFAKKWCKKNNIFDNLKDIKSSRGSDSKTAESSNTKTEIVKSLKALIFIDDDSRHMPAEPVEGLNCILFGDLKREKIPSHIKTARNWKNIVDYANAL